MTTIVTMKARVDMDNSQLANQRQWQPSINLHRLTQPEIEQAFGGSAPASVSVAGTSHDQDDVIVIDDNDIDYEMEQASVDMDNSQLANQLQWQPSINLHKMTQPEIEQACAALAFPGTAGASTSRDNDDVIVTDDDESDEIDESDESDEINESDDEETNEEEGNCSIKCGLHKLMKNSEDVKKDDTKSRLLKQIRDDAIKCTEIAAQASTLIHYHFNKAMEGGRIDEITALFNKVDNGQKKSATEQMLKQYFYGVLSQYVHSPGYPIQDHAPEFLEIMTFHNVQPRDNRLLHSQFDYMVRQYHTNFKNNIVMHTKPRLKKFFTFIQKRQHPRNTRQQKQENKDAVNNTLQFLFNGKVDCDEFLINQFTLLLEPNINDKRKMFYKIKRNWMQHIPLLFRLQRFIWELQQRREHDKLTRFIIVPLTTFQRRHIRIDKRGLWDVLSNSKCKPIQNYNGRLDRDNILKNDNLVSRMWRTHFNIDKVLPKNVKTKYFDKSINTDGVSISLSCKKENVNQITEEQRIGKIKQKFAQGEYTYALGLDPGKKLTFGGVRRTLTDKKGNKKEEIVERNIRVKSGTYYKLIGCNRIKKDREKMDADLQARMTRDRLTYPEISESCPHYVDFVNHRFRFFNERINVYCSHNYTRSKFHSDRLKKQAMHKITNDMCQGETALVVIGDAKMPKGIKGHRATPESNKFTKYFHQRRGCDVLLVKEKRTTMLCSLCRSVMQKPKKQPKARYRTCRNCVAKADAEAAQIVITHKSNRRLSSERKKMKKWMRREQELQQAVIEPVPIPAEEPMAIQNVDNAVPVPIPAEEPMAIQNVDNAVPHQQQQQQQQQNQRLVSKIVRIVKTNQADRFGYVVVVWNHDVNAGKSILYIGLCIVRGVPVDPVFTIRRLEDLNNN